MPDIPNPNVTIPLIIIIVCAVIAWVTYGHAKRQQEQIREERAQRRSSGRPAQPRPQVYGPAAGSTQALPTISPAENPYAALPPPPPPYGAPAPYDAPPQYEPVSAHAGPVGSVSPPANYDGANRGYQLPPLAYEPPSTVAAYAPPGSDFPAPAPSESAPSTMFGPGNGFDKDISELAPALPPSGSFSGSPPPPPGGAYEPPAKSGSSEPYLPSPLELEDWNRRYAPAVEEWILNHEEALDAVTVRHIAVEALDREMVARKVELTSHLDYAAHSHPSRQQGAELSEMLSAADGTLAAMRAQDFAGAEQNHSRYLSYRDIWLPRVQRALAP